MNEHPERMAPLLGKTYLDHTFAPMLIIHGTKDRLCNFEQTRTRRLVKKQGSNLVIGKVRWGNTYFLGDGVFSSA